MIPVVAIAGPPGAGKTTLVRAIAASLAGCAVVSYDDFPNPTHRSLDDLKAWFARGGNPDEFVLADLEDHLAKTVLGARSGHGGGGSAILFETPLGRSHRRTGQYIDFLVWIDVPLDIALARQLRALCMQGGGGPNQPPGAGSWLAGYLDAYLVILADLYRRQIAEVRPSADLVVNGLEPASFLAKTVIAAIA